jgi:hypothetical protein
MLTAVTVIFIVLSWTKIPTIANANAFVLWTNPL